MDNATQSLETIRKRIEHEDNLLNQRVSWIVSSQAFLLTGYAILLNAPLQLRNEEFVRAHALLMKLIPLTSICVTVLLWLGILAGILAMRDLRSCAEKHSGYEASHVQGRPLTRVIGLATPALVPVVFLITWLLLMLR
jgi:hypothetical protein